MLSRPFKQTWWHSIVITTLFWGGRGAPNIKSQEFLHRIVGVHRGDGGGLGWDGAILVQCRQDSRSNRMEEVIPGQNIVIDGVQVCAELVVLVCGWEACFNDGAELLHVRIAGGGIFHAVPAVAADRASFFEVV